MNDEIYTYIILCILCTRCRFYVGRILKYFMKYDIERIKTELGTKYVFIKTFFVVDILYLLGIDF